MGPFTLHTCLACIVYFNGLVQIYIKILLANEDTEAKLIYKQIVLVLNVTKPAVIMVKYFFQKI